MTSRTRRQPLVHAHLDIREGGSLPRRRRWPRQSHCALPPAVHDALARITALVATPARPPPRLRCSSTTRAPRCAPRGPLQCARMGSAARSPSRVRPSIAVPTTHASASFSPSQSSPARQTASTSTGPTTLRYARSEVAWSGCAPRSPAGESRSVGGPGHPRRLPARRSPGRRAVPDPPVTKSQDLDPATTRRPGSSQPSAPPGQPPRTPRGRTSRGDKGRTAAHRRGWRVRKHRRPVTPARSTAVSRTSRRWRAAGPGRR